VQRGVSPILLLVAVILALAVGAILYSSIKPQAFQNNSRIYEEPQDLADSNQAGGCASPVKFTHHFTDVSTIDSIIPPVFRNSKGTMPTTLINIQGKVPLYMPTSGKLTQGSYHNEQGAQFYMWEVDVGCGTTVVFDHVTEPVEKIKRLFPITPRDDTRTEPFDTFLEMAAGELVGHTTGTVNAHNWNFAVYDAAEKNYLWEEGEFNDRPKYYTQVCPFRYYGESMAKPYEDLFLFLDKDISVEKNLCE